MVADGRTGVLVDGHEPADYAAALERLLDDEQTRTEMGARAAKHAQQFGWARTAQHTLDAYAQAQRLMLAEAQAPATLAQ